MFVDRRFGGAPRYYLFPPKDAFMRIPEVFRKAVVFIGRLSYPGGVESRTLAGTAFIVGVPSADRQRSYLYLVTAKHVVLPFFDGPFWVRLNGKDGKAVFVDCVAEHKWWFHPTDERSVDAAVLPLGQLEGVDWGKIEFAYVITDDFLTDEVIEKRSIGPGNEVAVVGVFSKMQGRERNIPLVRTGNVAAIPEAGESIPNVRIKERRGDKIEHWQGDVEGYLVEVRSLGGLSGSPVFVYETASLQDVKDVNDPSRKALMRGIGPAYLMGLMHGHWYIKDEDRNGIVVLAVEEDHPDANIIGISVVVPAKKIMEILYRPELVELRRHTEEEAERAAGTTTSD